MTSSNFLRRSARVLTIAARFVGVWFLLGGVAFIVSAWVTPASRTMYALVGVFAVAVAVGLLTASPITEEHLRAIGGSVGKDKG